MTHARTPEPAEVTGPVTVPTGLDLASVMQKTGLSLRGSERRIILASVDLFLLWFALVTAVRWRTDWLDAPGSLIANAPWFVTLLVVWWQWASLLQSYNLARAASAPHSIVSAASAAALTVFTYQMIPVLAPKLAYRSLIVLFGLQAVLSIAVWRGLYAVLFSQPGFHQRALVLGAGWAGRSLAESLHAVPRVGADNPFRGTGYHLIGYFDDDAEKQAGGPVEGVPVLGSSRDLPRAARELQVDEVVLAITHRHTMSVEAFDALMACREQGIPVTTMPALYERLLGGIPVEHIGRDLAAVLPIEEGAAARFYHGVKRALDVVAALVGLVLVGIAIPVVAALNAIYSPGPLFYRQTRVGKGGRTFRILKFRTMRPDAERFTGAVWSEQNDPRITPHGRTMRKMRIDELPQFVNILKGEMSLIGPRPERPEFVEELAAQIPFYKARHAVAPGLTGWAQVRAGYGDSISGARTKLEYDLYYVRQSGFYLDMLIVLKTLPVVLKLQGR